MGTTADERIVAQPSSAFAAGAAPGPVHATTSAATHRFPCLIVLPPPLSW